MSSRVRDFVKDISVFSLQPILDKSLAIFLVPIYTTYLSTADYGIVSYVETIILVFTSITSLGLGPAFWRFINREGTDNRTVYTSVAINQSIAGFLAILVLLIPLSVAGVVRHPRLVMIYALASALNYPFTIVRAHLRIQHRASAFLVISFITTLFRLAVTIFFIVSLSLSFRGVIYGRAIPLIITGFYGVYFLMKNIGFRYSPQVSRDMVKFGIPLALSTLIGLLLTASDKLAIEYMKGSSELGLYAYANTFALLVTGFVFTPFFLAWVPHMWEIYRGNNPRDTFAYVARIVFLGSLFFGLIFPGAAVPLATILSRSPEFLAGLYLIPILASAQIMHGIYLFEDMGFYFGSKTSYITILTAVAAVVNLVCNIILIPKFGYGGAAVATLFSFLLLRCIGFYYSLKFYPYRRAKGTESLLLTIFLLATSFSSVIIYSGAGMAAVAGFSLVSASVLLIAAFRLHYISSSDLRKLTANFHFGRKRG